MEKWKSFSGCFSLYFPRQKVLNVLLLFHDLASGDVGSLMIRVIMQEN